MDRYAQRNIAPIDRQPYGRVAAPYGGAQEGWVSEHPWMTFFIVLSGISLVGTIVTAAAFSSAVSNLKTNP